MWICKKEEEVVNIKMMLEMSTVAPHEKRW
jgi:hypothetical protein